MKKMLKRWSAVLAIAFVAVVGLWHFNATQANADTPVISIQTELADLFTAERGEAFDANVIISRLPAANDFGWVSGTFQIHYDVERLEFLGHTLPIDNPARFDTITPPAHIPESGIITFNVGTNDFLHLFLDSATILLQFRIRDDAPSGVAQVGHYLRTGMIRDIFAGHDNNLMNVRPLIIALPSLDNVLIVNVPGLTHTVTFDLNGADAGQSIPPQTVINGDFATRPAPNPTRSGYTFRNWYVSGSVFDFATTPVTGDITIVAQWLADEPTDTPTDEPTDLPTDKPTDVPTDLPTDTPTDIPTDEPTNGQPGTPPIPPTTPPSTPPATPPIPTPPPGVLLPPGPTAPHIPWQPRPAAPGTGAPTGDTAYDIYYDVYDDTPASHLLPTPPEAAVNRLVFTVGSLQYLRNNQTRTAVGAPFIDPATDRMMIPLRTLSEALGISVAWDSPTRAAHIFLPTGTLVVPADQMLPDDMGTVMIVGDRIFVPLRFVMYAYEALVEWDSAGRAAMITW